MTKDGSTAAPPKRPLLTQYAKMILTLPVSEEISPDQHDLCRDYLALQEEIRSNVTAASAMLGLQYGLTLNEFCEVVSELRPSALRSETAPKDPLAQWKAKPSAEEIEAHYPDSQHQPDECEMCRFIHDAAKAYLAAPKIEGAAPKRGVDLVTRLRAAASTLRTSHGYIDMPKTVEEAADAIERQSEREGK